MSLGLYRLFANHVWILTESKGSSPAAYPNLSSNALDDLSYDMTSFFDQTLSHPSLHPENLGIIRGRKAWTCYLDVIVLSDAGNVWDAIWLGARAALWDTKVPRTRSIEYKATKRGKAAGDMDVDEDVRSGLDTRHMRSEVADFELSDYWDEGEVLDGRDAWPICVTLNIVRGTLRLDCRAEHLSRFLLHISWMRRVKKRQRQRCNFFWYIPSERVASLKCRRCACWVQERLS